MAHGVSTDAVWVEEGSSCTFFWLFFPFPLRFLFPFSHIYVKRRSITAALHTCIFLHGCNRARIYFVGSVVEGSLSSRFFGRSLQRTLHFLLLFSSLPNYTYTARILKYPPTFNYRSRRPGWPTMSSGQANVRAYQQAHRTLELIWAKSRNTFAQQLMLQPALGTLGATCFKATTSMNGVQMG